MRRPFKSLRNHFRWCNWKLSYDENFDEIVERKVREYMDESKEVEKRKMNLVINGIPESNNEDAVIRKEEDRDKVRNLFHTLGVEPTELSDLTVRLGKVTDRFPSRSLLISVKSTRAKGDVMKAHQHNLITAHPTVNTLDSNAKKCNEIVCYYTNVQSIMNKYDEMLTTVIEEKKPMIIGLTESWCSRILKTAKLQLMVILCLEKIVLLV